MGYDKVDYRYWKKVITRAQIGMSIVLFIVEIAVNTILYVSRQQGYNENTIVAKLLRYQLATTVFDVFVVAACYFICKQVADKQKEKYILSIAMMLICFNVAFSHYQFTPTFLTFIIPITFTIMYEDKKMCTRISILSLVMLIPAGISRGIDEGYNKDIIPEMVITYSMILLVCYFSHIIIEVMIARREELNRVMVQAEKAKYIDILNEKNKELEKLSRETFDAIAKSIDANDPYTAGHSRRVAKYSKMIAERMGITGDDLDEVYFAGLIHDVGKLGIDNRIINKNARLSEDEYEEIKKHPKIGYQVLGEISIKGNFAYGAKWHHERIDGKGYPDGLAGDSIPLIARIIAVADAYDAMTSKRSYRDIMRQSEVREQLRLGRGTQFDPVIADVMIGIIDDDTDYVLKQNTEGKDIVLNAG